MGIRIHKVMGYGLTDVKCKDGTIADPRFVSEEAFKEQDYDFYGHITNNLPKFFAWLDTEAGMNEACDAIRKANGDTEEEYTGLFLKTSIRIAKDNEDKYPHIFTHSTEGGNPKVVVFTPFDCLDWYRYDDIIDYYEAGGVAEAKVNKMTNNCGIYPYLGMVRIPGTKSEFKDFDKKTINPSQYNMLTGKWDKNQKPLTDKMPNGEKLRKELIKNFRPCIPESIIALIYYSKIFTNFQNTIQQLRPMIYTYWS